MFYLFFIKNVATRLLVDKEINDIIGTFLQMWWQHERLTVCLLMFLKIFPKSFGGWQMSIYMLFFFGWNSSLIEFGSFIYITKHTKIGQKICIFRDWSLCCYNNSLQICFGCLFCQINVVKNYQVAGPVRVSAHWIWS